MDIILYTIDCPKCLVLEKKLKQKGIGFIKVSNRETLISKGFGDVHFPILEVDGIVMQYNTAIEWLKNI